MTNKELIGSTLARHMVSCIGEYELVKGGLSPRFRTVKEFCDCHGFSHQNFMKFYHRYKENPTAESLLPQKRGPRYKTRRLDLDIEEKILSLRRLGNNRYEIVGILKSSGVPAPSPTTVYNVFRRYGVNKLTKTDKQEKRKIMTERIGEMAHVDCHQLPKGTTISEAGKTMYLLGVIDDYSRLAWVEVLSDKKAVTVMFATLRAFNMLKLQYGVEFDTVMTDNGAEFGSGPHAKGKVWHPFERLLIEMGMAHRYTKPYHPQTNGKIERFWRTLKDDFLEGALYENVDDLKEELLGFLVYYNEHRPHSAINGMTPREKAGNM